MDLLEIIVILAVALVVIGPERLPEVLRAVGKVMRELRSASNTVLRELGEIVEDDGRVNRPSSSSSPDARKAGQPAEKR